MIFSFLIPAILLSTADSSANSADTTHYKTIDEINVYSITSPKISTPYIEVTKSEIENTSVNTPADIISQKTGMALMRDGSWATSLNIRGMGEQRYMMMVDGDRLQSSTDVAGTLSTISLGNLEKIEVIKGAGSVLFGSGAVGGVVNFVNARPNYSDSLQISGKLNSAFSSVNTLFTENASLSVTNKNWYLQASGSYRNAKNTNTPAGIIPNSQFNDAAWAINGGIRNNDNHEFIVGYNEFIGWDAGIPGGSVFPKTATVLYKNIRRRQMSGEYIITDLTDVLTRLSLKGYTQNIARNVENTVNPTRIILPSSYNVTSGVKATADFDFNDYNKLTIGVESWVRRIETLRINILYGADTTVYGDQPTPMAKVVNTGAFALYKKIIDPKYLTINFGARMDYYESSNDSLFKEVFRYVITDGIRTNNYSGRILRTAPMKKPDFSYAAHIDLEYFPAKRNKLTLSLSTAYRIATIDERFKYIDVGGTPRIGNPNLKPEKGGFSNLNYIYTGQKFQFKADVFANYMFDLIAETSGTYTPISGMPFNALISNNINKALFLGAELEFKWIATSHLIVEGNASFVQAKNMSTKAYLTQIPPIHGLVKVNYRINKIGFAGLMAKLNANQFQAATTETKTPGSIILNLDLQSNYLKMGNTNLKAIAGVDNILNKQYKNHLFSTRGLDFYEPGRNIYAKLCWNW
jgi:hemoglobin/transferrin/lactoferrin receptor protein